MTSKLGPKAVAVGLTRVARLVSCQEVLKFRFKLAVSTAPFSMMITAHGPPLRINN